MSRDKVVLVDENDVPTGVADKIEAHQKGLLHRAFSVFVFNNRNEMLLQQRAFGKYHSAGLWSNTCCSHPMPGEDITTAAKRRLKEEMGIECEPIPLFTFTYKTAFDNGLTEHELDHVFYCISNKDPIADISEVNAWKWVPSNEIHTEITSKPDQYTSWFKIIAKRVMSEYPRINM